MQDPGSQSLLLQFVILLILTLFNAFFSASEMALVSLNRSKVEQKAEEGDKRYRRLLDVLENPNNFLSTIQVGITFISLLQGASLSASLGHVISGWLGNSATARTAGSIIALIFLTYVSIVLGELYPKRIAMNLKDRLAIVSAPIIIFLGKIVSPFVWLLSASTNLLSRITPMTFDDADEKMTRDEIEYMLTNSEETLEAEEIEMLQGIFSLDEMMAREVMVPRTDAFMIDINNDAQSNIEGILSQNFSRVPVFDDDKDRVVGILHTKRLLEAGFKTGFDTIDLRKILQEPLFVPETIFVDDLLKALRNTQNQMAILLDEYGGVAGLVTLEDLLEEIVGEIDDETDTAEQFVREIDENIYIVLGTMTLNEFNDYFETELESDDVDTIAGYYLTGVGSIPNQEEKVAYEVDSKDKHITLINDKVKDGRITKLKVLLSDIEQNIEKD
ncbi:TPA: hemolysin family protein [Streptococcus agalactiae]|uniref:hemolysin family protein n=1 Tax=Streptococcus agalactiae TaxID=1311 RepID=UPI0023AA0E97|nr:hemolysin family protein [Streptococcus agalactiae]EMA8750263.1 HlyC/CorC family transporter [Streptococcus agalactiae]EMA8752328.1 HlyC/CorC family transporter [Streptococcus agalactiae]MDX5031279.1 hemolysin family protein [Streptococcus agalactiae]WEA99471.1 hemolysin family protein [Streptococcus agalactiae]HEM9155641.1 HlyC/CorC family transporter [Streptococcus agalactiae]